MMFHTQQSCNNALFANTNEEGALKSIIIIITPPFIFICVVRVASPSRANSHARTHSAKKVEVPTPFPRVWFQMALFVFLPLLCKLAFLLALLLASCKDFYFSPISCNYSVALRSTFLTPLFTNQLNSVCLFTYIPDISLTYLYHRNKSS